MKITIYELLGKVKDDNKTDIYVKYFNRISQKEETMWACKDNIIYKLDQIIVKLNDEVEILDEPKKIEKLNDKLGRFGDGNTQKIINELNYTRTIINELIDEINNLKESK